MMDHLKDKPDEYMEKFMKESPGPLRLIQTSRNGTRSPPRVCTRGARAYIFVIDEDDAIYGVGAKNTDEIHIDMDNGVETLRTFGGDVIPIHNDFLDIRANFRARSENVISVWCDDETNNRVRMNNQQLKQALYTMFGV
jgi:hypothetical protein